MTSDTEKKWEELSDVYCSLLEETAKQLRTMKSSIPDDATKRHMVEQIEKITGLGKQLPRYMVVKQKAWDDF